MNIIRSIFIISIFYFIFSCDRSPIYDRTYELFNDTSHDISLHFYKRGNKLTNTENTLLSEKMAFSKSTLNKRGEATAYEAFENPDSLIIVYDDIKYSKMIHDNFIPVSSTICGIDENLFLDDGYTIINRELFRYTFTEENYQNAKELGECD